MASDTIRALQVNDTEITTRVVRDKALHQDCADGTGVEVSTSGADSGKLRLVSAGTSLANGVQADEMSKFAGAVIQGSLSDGNGLAGIFSETNSYGTDLIAEVDMLITTIATAACTLDVGVGSAAAIRDGSLDEFDVNGVAAPFVYSSVDSTHAGTNGRARVLWANGGILHGSTKTGDATGLVGTYAIRVLDIN